MNLIATYAAAAGSSIEALSRKTSLPVERMRSIFDGDEPSLDEARRIAAALGVSMGDLLAEESEESDARILFRQSFQRRQSPSPGIPEYLAQYIANAFEILGPEPRGTEWVSRYRIQSATTGEAERLAQQFRHDFFGGDYIGPLLRLPEILGERVGCLVFVVPIQRVDGASAALKGRQFVFLAPRFKPRMLFTLAHELGHLLAHHDASGSFATVDDEGNIGNYRGKDNEEESFSDAFASCLLMPVEGVGVALKTLKSTLLARHDVLTDVEILYLSRIFGVSFEVAARRCETLQLLSLNGARSLVEKITADHGSPERRAEEMGLPDRPEIRFPKVPSLLLRKAVERIAAGDISIGRASSILGLPVRDLVSANAS